MAIVLDGTNGITSPNETTGALTATSVTASGAITAASVTTTGATGSLNSINTFGFKNRIINGNMAIDQRNAGVAKTLTAGASTYVLDRFYVATNGGAGVVQQVTGSSGFTKAMRITGAAGITDGYFGQKIESYNIADAASSTVTYKIRASSSVLTSLTWYARFPTAQDNYTGVTLITSGSITINSTPTDYSFQIALPSGVTNGIEVYFTFGAFTSGTLDITGVQLEKGSVATSFDQRAYSQELAMCQRYLPALTNTVSGTYAISNAGGIVTTTTARITIPFQVAARVPPTGLTTTAASGFYLYNGSQMNQSPTALALALSGIYQSEITATFPAINTLGIGQFTCFWFQTLGAQLLFTGCEL